MTNYPTTKKAIEAGDKYLADLPDTHPAVDDLDQVLNTLAYSIDSADPVVDIDQKIFRMVDEMPIDDDLRDLLVAALDEITSSLP